MLNIPTSTSSAKSDVKNVPTAPVNNTPRSLHRHRFFSPFLAKRNAALIAANAPAPAISVAISPRVIDSSTPKKNSNPTIIPVTIAIAVPINAHDALQLHLFSLINFHLPFALYYAKGGFCVTHKKGAFAQCH